MTSQSSQAASTSSSAASASNPNSILGASQIGKSAFNWDVYKNRKTALQYLRRNYTLVDTILESEDGQSFELVHSQVISAFGDKLNQFINQFGVYVDSYKSLQFSNSVESVIVPQASKEAHNSNSSTKAVQLGWSRWPGKVKLIRVPKLSKYTLSILVECAYSGYIRTDLSSGGIWQVLQVADHYQMLEVLRACCAFLMKNLNCSNCVHFYHIGIRHKHPLQRAAWHMIRANFKHILADNLQREALNQQPTAQQVDLEAEAKANNLATMKLEHFEALLVHDKLNVDSEESVWFAIRHWCNFALNERSELVAKLLGCIRFARLRSGVDFSARHIWRDQLVLGSKRAQQELAILDRNQRDLLQSSSVSRDGLSLPCAPAPLQLRPRVPHSILLAIGGWQQGQPTTLIESYDLNCNLWFESKSRIVSPLAYHGLECIQGLLYICGGTDGSEILNEVFSFDPVRGDCQQRPSMREPRCYVSTAHLGEHLYAMGGHNGSQRIKSVERWQWSGGQSWVSVSDMNVARSDASACVHQQLIYIAGGLNDQLIESSVEFYNQRDNSWTFMASMLTPRTSFTLLLFQSCLLAIGGNNGQERLASVEQYSFETRSWSAHSSMRHRRSTFSAALLERDKLVVVGGYNGQTPFSQVEMWDLASRSWQLLQRIRFDRSGLKVVCVRDLPNAADFSYLGSSQCQQQQQAAGQESDSRRTGEQQSLAVSLSARARQRFLRSLGRRDEQDEQNLEEQ